ncbi:hypothetical protein GXW82_30605 [Streptacidiphilus sp. 4-A2]|nr:hypothetical protein [Streptacidiphilus sp. 4-A2]
MHDRALAPLSRRRSPQQAAAPHATPDSPGAAPHAAGYAELALLDHAGLPRLLGRRARWMTSRLRQR